MACVGRDADVEAVTRGPDGAFQAMKAGAVFVDHTTASAGIARSLAADAEAAGFGFVDAPISGGEQGAKNGQLTIMCGGGEADLCQGRTGHGRLCAPVPPSSVRPVPASSPRWSTRSALPAWCRACPKGSAFARAAGLDPQAVIDVISKGAAQSWQMENRHKTMLAGEYDHGFAVEWMRKDLGICLAEARNNGASLPVTALVDQFYAEVENMDGARWDTSSLFARMELLRKGRA